MRAKILICFILLTCLVYLNKAQAQDSDYIEFGSGGGFSGKTISYRLLPDGSLMKSESRTEPAFQSYKKLSKKTFKKLKVKICEAGFFNVSIDKPYNLSYFITGSYCNKSNKIIWGDPTYTLPENFQELYKELLRLTE